MRFSILALAFLAAVAFVECNHTFIDPNGFHINPKVHFENIHKARTQSHRTQLKNYHFDVPSTTTNIRKGRYIRSILAYDRSHAKNSSVIVTQGGPGHTFVDLKIKSERGKDLNYDLYIIYA